VEYPTKKDEEFWNKFGCDIHKAIIKKSTLTNLYGDLIFNMAFIYSTAMFDANFIDILKILFLSTLKV
jgi:hypothetical protein